MRRQAVLFEFVLNDVNDVFVAVAGFFTTSQNDGVSRLEA